MIRTTYDPEADVLNIQFGPAEAASDGHQEVAPGIYVEFDAAGHPIGVEITSVRLRQTAPAASAKAAAECGGHRLEEPTTNLEAGVGWVRLVHA